MSDSLQIRSFHPAFPIFMTETKEQIALHRSSSLFVKEDIRYRRSFKKSDENESLEKSQIGILLHFEFINDSNHVNLFGEKSHSIYYMNNYFRFVFVCIFCTKILTFYDQLQRYRLGDTRYDMFRG